MRREKSSRAGRVARCLGVLLVLLASTAAFAGPPDVDVNGASTLGLMTTASELKGSSVVNLSGKEIARIEGLFIDPKSGQVEFVALRFEPQGTMLALPWSTLAFEGTHAILDATDRQMDRAPRVDASMLGGECETKAPMAKEIRPSIAREPEPVEAMKGYAPLRAYERRFDPTRMETLQGVIRGTIVEPLKEPKAVDVIAFLETGPQSSELLALAPDWYLKKQHLDLEPAQKITVTGSQVDSEVGTLLVVTSIKVADRTVELRTKNGSPLWRQSS